MFSGAPLIPKSSISFVTRVLVDDLALRGDFGVTLLNTRLIRAM